jgi:hypothetical protein
MNFAVEIEVRESRSDGLSEVTKDFDSLDKE